MGSLSARRAGSFSKVPWRSGLCHMCMGDRRRYWSDGPLSPTTR